MIDPFSPRGKTWSCPVCGVIHPTVAIMDNRITYTVRLCECQKKELALIEKEKTVRWLRLHPEVA